MTAYTVVTVAHESAAELALLLTSLKAHGDPPVVVVDTDSKDDSVAVARAHGATVVDLGANPGFGAANNTGLEHVDTEITVLANPDIVVTDSALAALAARAAAEDAIHAPGLISPDGTRQDSAHAVPGSAAELLRAFVPGRIVPGAEPWRRTRGPVSVGWVIAACVAARTETLRRLGPFDPDAFLFYEDLELCLHARETGVPTILHPELTVQHTGAHSTGPALGPALLPQAQRRRDVVGARLGPRALQRDDYAQSMTFGNRMLVRKLLRRDPLPMWSKLMALQQARQNSSS